MHELICHVEFLEFLGIEAQGYTFDYNPSEVDALVELDRQPCGLYAFGK